MAGNNVQEFTSSNWQKEVLESTVPVVVDFWAVWCGPCRMIGPSIDQLADEYAGRVKVGKVNVDDEQELAVKYRVTNIPRVYIFNGGELKDEMVGVKAKDFYQAAINRVLAS
jgi:thioredoxin 1